MNRTSFRRVLAPSAAMLALGLTLTACGDSGSSGNDGGGGSTSGSTGLSGTLSGAGSSAQGAAQTAWIAKFQSANPNVTLNYDPAGSGAGREQFIAGGVPFAGSDSYMTTDELTQSKTACQGQEAFDVPDYVSPIAIVYNLKGVDKLQLNAEVAAKIFNGSITKWNDAAIAQLNPGATLPGSAITPVHRSDDSGTQANFTDWMSKAGNGVWTDAPSATWPLKSGEGANGTSGVIEAVTNGAGTIGFADNSQAGDLQVASLQVGGAYVAPSADAANITLEKSPRATGRPDGDMAIDVNRTITDAGAYPLILVSYVIACPTYKDAATAANVKAYLSYLVSDAGQQDAASAAGSAPLPTSIASEAATVVGKISAG